MNKTAFALCTLLLVLVSIFHFSGLVSANFDYKPLPIITIKEDGRLEPQTEYINQTGNIYTLTANLTQTYCIRIECSNIIFDGARHKIDCLTNSSGNIGLWIIGANDVLVKDLEVISAELHSILIQNCHNCTILRARISTFITLENSDYNTISDSNLDIQLITGYHNVFVRNNITAFSWTQSDSNIFYQNDFLSNYSSLFRDGVSGSNSWDNGTVGNFWSDYQVKYPNASEIGSSGIGDSPYIIDQTNRDNYPLVMPYETSPSQEPTPEPETLPLSIVIVASVGIALAIIGLLFYIRKSHRDKGQ
jgi:hypothetical protein